MLRAAVQRLNSTVQCSAVQACRRQVSVTCVRLSHGHTESAEDFDNRYETYFNRQDIDGWEIRKAMNDLHGHDVVPEPRIVIAALRACRRVNDHSLAVRYLEAVKDKCGKQAKVIWPYMMQEVQPTLTELGISSPEELGYDKPELALQDVYDM